MALTDADNQWITADQPIASRKEDRLSRSEFSKELATAIAGWSGHSSLTIAIYGAWGNGKSSVKNMTVEYLQEQPAPHPTIIEFNPWRWNNSDELTEAFFREVGKGLGKGDDAAKAKKQSNLWRQYAASFSVAGELMGVVPKFVGALLIMSGILSLFGYVLALPQISQHVAGLLVSVAPLIVGLLLWSGRLSEKIAKYFDAKSTGATRSLDERRSELESELSTRNAPVVVIVDDIDRLANDRIALIFQLIKATADLPRFVYLLLFQREIVEKSLNRVANEDGAGYLEKIVQIGLDLPDMAKPEVEKILFDGLNEILTTTKARTFDQTRWGNIYVGGLNAYFRNIRDVKRYLSSLKFHIPLFIRGTSFEVNIIDLFTVEAMRLFEPKFYQQLRTAKTLLTSGRPSDQRSVDTRKSTLQRIVENSTHDRHKELQETLVRLFPQAAWAFGGTERASPPFERWLKELRICSPDVYDRYLHFSVSANDVSQAELDDLISRSGDRDQLVEALRALTARGLASTALDRLNATKELIPLESAVPFVTALFDIGDELVDPPGVLAGPERYLARLIRGYLRQEQDPGVRLDILKQAIRETTGLIQLVQLAAGETDEKRRSESPDRLLINDAEANSLILLCVEKIVDSAQDGQLYKNRHLATILHRWLQWAGADPPRKWVAEQCKSSEGALIIVNAFTHRGFAQTSDDHVGRVTARVSLEELEKFVDIELLETSISELSQADRNEEEQTAIREFHRAVGRRREGKSENDDFADDN